MQQWNGLLKREWASMSGPFYASVGATTLVTLLIPLSNQIFNWGIEFLVILFGVSIMWMMLGAGIPTVLFLMSFVKEMNRPDIWLHSTASIFKLFGSKAAFAGFVGAMNTVITIIVSAVGLLVSGYQFGPTFKAIVLLFILLYMLSLLIMCAGIFVGVLYQLINSFSNRIVAPILLLLFWFSLWLVEKLAGMEIYKKIKGLGPIRGPSEGVFHFGHENFPREIDDIVFYTGDILMGLLVGVLLFITAVTLFEKKVRI